MFLALAALCLHIIITENFRRLNNSHPQIRNTPKEIPNTCPKMPNTQYTPLNTIYPRPTPRPQIPNANPKIPNANPKITNANPKIQNPMWDMIGKTNVCRNISLLSFALKQIAPGRHCQRHFVPVFLFLNNIMCCFYCKKVSFFFGCVLNLNVYF